MKLSYLEVISTWILFLFNLTVLFWEDNILTYCKLFFQNNTVHPFVSALIKFVSIDPSFWQFVILG